ncbi:hypothetical protein LTR37_011719 [Vermiconidia calcicola]|uniref:Uncharacterized protein n=1 Tax=Vermiconidia calcicola TaxID=1690605 RepID=A0ACC3N1G6_9PEZI|nr:hypothetical protein LTR37_011719 [Vermiconidia calcicola]
MADAVALNRAGTNTGKMAALVKGMWDERSKIKAANGDSNAFEMVLRAQVDEVFLVLAHLGEAIIPLGIFNKEYYLQTLGDVQAAISSCGNDMLSLAWAELDAELQYVCTAGFTICACFAPIPVYRGFGASVLGDWDWACPDMAYLEEKAKKRAIRTVYGVKQKTDAQPTRSVFLAFDQVIQVLQVKPMAFLVKRPLMSGFTGQPHYGLKPKKDAKEDFEWLEQWLKHIEKRGHPTPKGVTRNYRWGVPFATWTSPYSCHIIGSHKECETLAYHQMDPGRLLHAFICRGNVNLSDSQILLLLPGSPAESLLCWLEGLPGTPHKIIKWEDLYTENFEKKISKTLRKRIGQHPLPALYAIRNPDSITRPGLPAAASSPAVLEHPNTVSPPPYSPHHAETRDAQAQSPAAELGGPDAMELPAGPVASSALGLQHTASLPVPGTNSLVSQRVPGLPATTGLKSIHTLRRKPSDLPFAAYKAPAASSTGASIPMKALTEKERSSSVPMVAELHSETAPPPPPRPPKSEIPVAVELPTDFQSEAPRPLDAKPQNVVTEPVTESNAGAAATQIARKPVNVQGSEDSMKEVTSHETSAGGEKSSIAIKTAKAQNQSNTESATPNDRYLELLNRVARGEVSPQALSAMLENGSFLTKPATDPTTMSEDPAKPFANTPSSLPYPITPVEGKPSQNAASGTYGHDVPASLMPGRPA